MLIITEGRVQANYLRQYSPYSPLRSLLLVVFWLVKYRY